MGKDEDELAITENKEIDEVFNMRLNSLQRANFAFFFLKASKLNRNKDDS
jgi:hypothetical protein